MTDKFYYIGTGMQKTFGELVSILLEEVGATQLSLFIPHLNDDSRQFVNVKVGSTAAAAADLGFN